MTSKLLLPLLFITCLTTACGGGGGSSGPDNQPPTASFSTDIASTVDPFTVNLDASASSDSDGSIASYSWEFGDGNSGTGATISHTYTTAGNYQIRLTVTDDDGATATSSQDTQITTNVVAAITLSGNASGPAPLAVTFDGSSSQVLRASGGSPNITSYQWDFGDGASDNGAVVNHTYTANGRFTARLTVTDSSGDTDTTEVLIKTVFNLSGTISAASSSSVDIDVNDPSRQDRNFSPSAFQTNNTNVDAQALPNPAILNGFISATGAGLPPSGRSNFENEGDVDDYYSTQLIAGQFVSLRVSDFDASSPSSIDIDLELYDSNLNLVASSNSMTEFESVAVTTTANYFIRVRAVSGISKYVLNIGATSMASGAQAYGIPADFVTGEAIVKMKPINLLAAQSVNSQPVTGLSHRDTSRSALTRFTISNRQAAAASAQTSNQNARLINEKNHAKLVTLNRIKQLNARADVEYAEPNYRVHAMLTPNDSFYFLQAHYPQINLPQAWNITTGTPASGSVVVAVIDTGVVLSHEDLVGQFVSAADDYDFIRDTATSLDGDGIDPNPDDPGDGTGSSPSSWHGTHVAGTIAAATNNNRGVAGVSWGAKIMPIRVLGLDGGTTYDVEQGVRFAAGLSNDSGTVPSKRADIINLSLGGPGFSQSSQSLYTQVANVGVIVIASAGNENTSVPSYPASYDNVVSVSAVDLTNNLAPYSNFGSRIDIAAPGGDLSVDRNGDGYGDGVLSTTIDKIGASRNPIYQFYQGTSMAAPHVAGVAALMKAIHPGLTPSDFYNSLQTGLLTTDIGSAGRDDQFGYGLIDALKAVQQAQLLAGGSATGSILASPTRIDFGTVLTSRTLTLTQVGSSPPRVTNVSSNADWLTVDASASDVNGAGTYTIMVDRSGLADATYSDNVVFALDNGNNLTIPVTVQVQNTVSATGDAGFLFVLLLDADTLDFVQQDDVDVVDGQYQYSFTNIPAGEYVVIAGSDIDNDFFICSLGESCGRYPTNDRPQRIVVNDDVDGLNFLATILSDAISSAQSNGDRAEGVARQNRANSNELSTEPETTHKNIQSTE